MQLLIFPPFIILLLCGQVKSETHDLYNQMKKLNISCNPFDSCKNFTDSMNDHLWNEQRICECGPHCVRFATCCADSPHVFGKPQLPLPEHEQCQNLHYFPTPVIMVSQCDDSYKWSSSIIEKCEKGTYSSNGSLSENVPLTNFKTFTTYKNYFCALCNNGGKGFLYWQVSLNTKNRQLLEERLTKYGKSYILKNVRYDAQINSWMFSDNSTRTALRIKVRYILPPYLRKIVKPCIINLIKTCKSSRSKSLIKQECQAYYSPIEIKTQEGPFVYKNIYCAMCNTVNTSSDGVNSCLRSSAPSMRTEQCRAFTFGHLLDMNHSKGNKVGMTEIPEPYCGADAVYDPFAKKCRKILCLPGQILVNGKCVRQ